MKKIIWGLTVTSLFTTFTVNSADPVWLEGKTETEYSVDVYHSPTCGCCKGWIEHLEDHNFVVNSIEMDDVSPIKQRLGIPPQAASCHTAVVNGVAVEGHVPAQDIKSMLANRNTDIRLLTVPGMPSGGPGMDMPGARKDQFKVYAVSEENKISVYNSYDNY